MTETKAPESTISNPAAPAEGGPVVIVGAGPAGLAAAAQAQARGLSTVVLEAGEEAGAAVRDWAHVRLFSTWAELVEPASLALLKATGWDAPDPATYPSGQDWVESYLKPLAYALEATDEVSVRYGHHVIGLTRTGRDRMVDSGRTATTFTLHVQTPTGPTRLRASAVIDASGTWGTPNPLGADGLPALGEAEHADRISYAIPDLANPEVRTRYAGKHVVVAGKGASGHNALIGLTALADQGTRISWLLRRPEIGDAFGGGDTDELQARGDLGTRAREAVTRGPVTTVAAFRTAEVTTGTEGKLVLTAEDGATVDGVDEVIVVAGFRPDLSWLSEVRLNVDNKVGAPAQVAEMVDSNNHSCGDFPATGAAHLEQPDTGLYIAGMKSYGRGTTFLSLTGFEQTRSIVAAIAGDHEAAARVELKLPDTGVCHGSGQFDGAPDQGGSCCGVPAPAELVTIGSAPSSGSASSCG